MNPEEVREKNINSQYLRLCTTTDTSGSELFGVFEYYKDVLQILGVWNAAEQSSRNICLGRPQEGGRSDPQNIYQVRLQKDIYRRRVQKEEHI